LTPQGARTLRQPKEKGNGVVLFNPDGRRLITVDPDQTLTVWDVRTGKAIRTDRVRGEVLAFSPDRTQFALVTEGRTAQVCSTATGEPILSLTGHEQNVIRARFSPDGRRLATVGQDLIVKVWDLMSGQELAALPGHTAEICDLAFTTDGQRLATASTDGTVRLWDLNIGQEALSLRTEPDPVIRLEFSPDDERLFAIGGGEVRVWDATPMARDSARQTVVNTTKAP
jgi:WD40 repeat protein